MNTQDLQAGITRVLREESASYDSIKVRRLYIRMAGSLKQKG